MATKTTTSSKTQQLGDALKNPKVQQFLVWALPLVFGWILSKLSSSTKPVGEDGKVQDNSKK